MAEIVSERYALSLYEIAKQENKVQAFMDELNAICDIFSQNPDFMKVLKNPSIRFAEKQKTLSAVFEGKLDPYVLNFLMLITERHRISLIFEMAEGYKQQYYFEEGICEVTAITAEKMDDALTEKLKNKMCAVTGKKVVLKTVVDESIIGGIVIKVDNKQIDTSVRTRINELAQQLTHVIA